MVVDLAVVAQGANPGQIEAGELPARRGVLSLAQHAVDVLLHNLHFIKDIGLKGYAVERHFWHFLKNSRFC